MAQESKPAAHTWLYRLVRGFRAKTSMFKSALDNPRLEARKMEHDYPPTPSQRKRNTSTNHPTSTFQPVGVCTVLPKAGNTLQSIVRDATLNSY